MKKIIILLFLFVTQSYCSEAFSQPMQYTYDAAGNRIKKEIDLNPGQLRKAAPIKDQIASQSVTIYPNPTTESIRVEVDQLNDGGTSITLLDMNGKLVFERKKINLVNEYNLSNQAKGKYILQLRNGKEVSNWVIIKH